MKTCKFGCGRKAIHQYKDGTWCCSSNVSKCPEIKKKMSRTNTLIPHQKTKCSFCKRKITLSNLNHHAATCYLNPKNLRLCPVCGDPIKDSNHTTCSNKCKGKYFKEVYSACRTKPDDELKDYRIICFRHHEKKCVICGEENVTEVHHFDEEKSNNNKDNLIPLCPTHHKYMHNRFKSLIEQKVNTYIANFKADVA